MSSSSHQIPGPASTPNLTLAIPNEDDTLGNALRSIVIGLPEVTFAGHSKPHPTQDVLHFRAQLSTGSAVETVDFALGMLEDLCAHLKQQFRDAVEKHQQQPAGAEVVPVEGRPASRAAAAVP
eukprot:GHVU01042062.1.p1 GENE.GHVU01042062.1~~GHVU01042062.1.p1  ORF type:complete len:123 (+),score=20.96 GHVU01042062.1:301-669(+)